MSFQEAGNIQAQTMLADDAGALHAPRQQDLLMPEENASGQISWG